MMPYEDEPVSDGTGEAYGDIGVGVGPTSPAAGQGVFSDLLGLARQFVPGVSTIIGAVQRVGSLIGSLTATGGTGVSAFGNQISSRSALGQDPNDFPGLFTGTSGPQLYLQEGPLEIPPIYRTNFIADTALYSGEEASMIVPTGSAPGPFDLAIPMGETIPKTLVNWLKRIAIAYGPAVANAVWMELQKRRRAGQSTTLAKAVIDEQYPVRGRIMRRRRRRMNPANIHALRRALRRVRGFRRVTRKVHGVFPIHRGGKVKTVYRRARRGDLWDVEDRADDYDEAEDLGYDPGDFFDVEE